ncbi:hypothetical protein Nepgr_032168 [Nepenthes gracilis]|uniref:TF-B3 domain-containing protein n=1 Tax=Nepenthes gracilis TaxID=150966 RepID=A0AAD3TIT1_NEPGR|nr:hypothetical protein Nepgr_032168 [Nepenthes gracilis]
MSASSTKICFNNGCKDLKPERFRKGWRLRNGEYAEICDRCSFAFEEGRFCETFHPHDSGWRCCESCGRRVHCGCIVSAYAFVLLDAGGIQCVMCARKNSVLTPNPGWLTSLFPPLALPDRLKEPSVKKWNTIIGTGSSGSWLPATNLFNPSTTNSDLQPRMPFVVDVTNGVDRIAGSDRLASFLFERSKIHTTAEILSNGSMGHKVSEMPEYKKAVFNYEEKPSSCLTNPLHPSLFEDKPSTPNFASETDSQTIAHGLQSPQMMPPLVLGKPITGCLNNGVDSSSDAHLHNTKLRADPRGRNQLLPRYWPRISDQELQQISGDSNSVITPLFEKMLSASDAGRIGRLVLPKKCAETYFPPISQPEGLPLKVQDVKGKDWIFQFRFWPNNNSRMYVLEGITPCIQSMQLQAGDVVTFSRLEPEGKLIMGFRKASTVPLSDQGMQPVKISNGMAIHGDVNVAHKSGYIAKEALGASLSSKRKNALLSSKSKLLRLNNIDIIELKVTLEEVQGLLRPCTDHASNVVKVEEFEIEEYEDAPVIGRPATVAADSDSRCEAAEDLKAEQLEDLLPLRNQAASKKQKAAKQDRYTSEVSEGLDTLANLAILEDADSSPSSSQPTTKHPRHRPGCSCIVCIQPPSGKGPKHKPACACGVCLTVRRRFQTQSSRRERKQTKRETETVEKRSHGHLQLSNNPEPGVDLSEGGSDDDPSRRSTVLPFKGQIDLNIRPDREDLSPSSD